MQRIHGRRAATRRAASRRTRRRFFAELPFLLVAALVLTILVKGFLIQAFFIPSRSMEPTLDVGEPNIPDHRGHLRAKPEGVEIGRNHICLGRRPVALTDIRAPDAEDPARVGRRVEPVVVYKRDPPDAHPGQRLGGRRAQPSGSYDADTQFAQR